MIGPGDILRSAGPTGQEGAAQRRSYGSGDEGGAASARAEGAAKTARGAEGDEARADDAAMEEGGAPFSSFMKGEPQTGGHAAVNAADPAAPKTDALAELAAKAAAELAEQEGAGAPPAVDAASPLPTAEDEASALTDPTKSKADAANVAALNVASPEAGSAPPTDAIAAAEDEKAAAAPKSAAPALEPPVISAAASPVGDASPDGEAKTAPDGEAKAATEAAKPAAATAAPAASDAAAADAARAEPSVARADPGAAEVQTPAPAAPRQAEAPVRAAADNPASNVGAQAAKPSPFEGGASAPRALDQGRIGDAPPPDAAPDLPADGRVEPGPARNAAALSAVVGGVGEATSLAAPAARDAVAGPRFELTPIAPQPLAPTDKAAAQAGAIVNQISIAVAGADRNKVEIRLDPPELGRVSVSLSLGDEGARAVIAVERQDVSDLLRRHGDMLQRDLAEAGFGDVSLEFADGGEAAQRGDEPEPESGGRDDLATHEISQIAVARPADAGRRLDLRL